MTTYIYSCTDCGEAIDPLETACHCGGTTFQLEREDEDLADYHTDEIELYKRARELGHA